MSGPGVGAVSEGAEQRTVDDVLQLLLGAPLAYTRDEIQEAVGLSPELLRELWRALGFADVGDERAFTDADVVAIRMLASLVQSGQIDRGTAVDLVRSMGQTTARLAEWQAEALGRRLVARGEATFRDGVRERELLAVYHDASVLLPPLEQLLVYAWRRQMSAVVGRRMAEVDEALRDGEATATVAFADLVRFTRLSRQLEEDQLARLVERFESTSADVVAATGARLVKTLGDEVLFVADHPEQVAEAALRLHETHAKNAKVPQMRIGIASGTVITRMGDVFGTTVNLASRLTAMARRGSTLVDSHSARALEKHRTFRLRPMAPRPVRGLGLVRPFLLTRGRRGGGK